MYVAQGANAKPAFFDSRNSPPPSNGMNLRFQDHQNRVRSDLAVSAEKRNMAYQRGSLKKVRRKEGEIWVLRYRVTNSTGKRVENVMPIGLVQEFPKDEDARREANRLGPSVRINDSSLPGRVRFIFSRSIISGPISAGMPYARNWLIPSVTSSKSCAPISSCVSERNRRRYQAARYSTVAEVATR